MEKLISHLNEGREVALWYMQSRQPHDQRLAWNRPILVLYGTFLKYQVKANRWLVGGGRLTDFFAELINELRRLWERLRLTFKCSSQLANCLHVAGASLLHAAGRRPLNNELAMLSRILSMPISPAMACGGHAIKLKGTMTAHMQASAIVEGEER